MFEPNSTYTDAIVNRLVVMEVLTMQGKGRATHFVLA